MKKKDFEMLREFLGEQVLRYNRPEFIDADPVSIPHLFTTKEDIEISGLLTAVIAWGQRKTILANAKRMMKLMDNAPHQFIMHHSKEDLKNLEGFVHRTYNSTDMVAFVEFLKKAYQKGGLETLFLITDTDIISGIERCRTEYLKSCREKRSAKHFPSPLSGSAAKRINMFLRWMVRKDQNGVDFGIWDSKFMPSLMCPLDVHSGNVARKLGILKRKQNDWKAVVELTDVLRKFDAKDPVKYDFALFGLGVDGF